MLELASQERREGGFAGHGRPGAGHEQPDRRAVGVLGRVERRHDPDAGLRGRGREQGEGDEGHAHRAILTVCEDQGMTVTDALPVYHHRERHSVRVAATPEAALAAARETRLEDVPVVSILFRLRGLRAAPRGPIWASLQAQGFQLARPRDARPDRPALDAARRHADGRGLRPLHGAGVREDGAWISARCPTAAVRALETETRVFLTDAASRRRFGAYWLLIRPFSGLTRRLWLRAAKRRAER